MLVRVIGSGDMWTKNNSACFLINEEILIDIPNGTCKNLKKINVDLNKIEGVLITHLHGDHYFDLPFYLIERSNKKLISNIIIDESNNEKIEKLVELAFFEDAESINKSINYICDKNICLDKYKIEKLLVCHNMCKPAYGYIINFENKKIAFTGDSIMCENVEYMASLCDYLFCDCTVVKGNISHMGINDLEFLLKKYPNCKIVASHIGDESRKELLNKNINNIIIPNDGDLIRI